MNQHRLLCFVALSLLTGTALAGSRGPLRQGEKAYRNGDYPASFGYFNEALAQDPENPEAHFDLGASAYRQGDLDGAATRFARVAESSDPAWAGKGFYNLGNTRLQQQDAAGAVEAYIQALKKDPGLEDARWNLELALQQLQQQQQQSGGDKDQDSKDKQDGEKQDGKDQGQQNGDKGQQDSQGKEGQQQQGQQGQQGQDEPSGQAGRQGKEGEKGEPADSAAQAMPVSQEQLDQILQAIAQQEKAALRKQMPQQPAAGRRVEKDW